MKTTYENEEYFVCETTEDLKGKLLNHRKAILISDMNLFKSQFNDVFKFVQERFGSESEELKKVFSPKLFCGSCGVAFTQTLLLNLIGPENMHGLTSKNISSCPKCGSEKLSIIYKLF